MDVSTTKTLTIRDKSIYMDNEVVASWSDDRTDIDSLTVNIKYNNTEVKNGDSFRDEGTLTITITDDEGLSSTAEIKLNATNNPPQINIIKSEVDVSATKTLTIRNNSAYMGDEVVASWTDDRTVADSLAVSIKYNNTEVKSGDSFRDNGTILITVTDDEGLSATAEIKLNATNNPPQINIIKSEVDVSATKTLTIRNNSIYMDNEVVASWTDDRTAVDSLTFSVKYNGNEIKSGDSFRNEGTLTITVTDNEGLSANAEIKLNATNNPPQISIIKTEVDVSATKTLTVRDNSIYMDNEAVASWTDDRTIVDSLTISIKYNGNEVKSGDSFKDNGTISITITDSEGLSANAEIKLNATNNPPQISIIKTEVDVSATKTLTIRNNSAYMGDEVVASWTDDRTVADSLAVSIKYNNTEVKSGDSFRDNGTILITVTDDEGLSSTAEIKLNATNNPPQINIIKSEEDVSATKTLTIRNNSIYMDNEVVASWTDDRTAVDSLTFSVKYNGNEIKSGDSFRNKGTLTITVTDNEGLSANAEIKLNATNNPPQISIIKTEVDVSATKTLTVRDNSIYMDNEAVASWTDDRTIVDSLTISIKYNGNEVKSGDSFKDNGTISITITDSEGLSANAEIKLNATNNPPQINIIKSEVDVSTTKALTIRNNSAYMGDEVVASWTDDRTVADSLTVSIKYNNTEVKSGDSFRDNGTILITVTDDEGLSSTAEIKLNATNNPPQINIIKSEEDVSATKTLTIRDNSIYMDNEAVASWSDDRTNTDSLTVSVKYNGNEVKSGDSFRNDGTISITVTDDEGLSSTAEIKLNVTNNPPQIQVLKTEINVL